MKRNIQRLFKCSDDALIPVEHGGDPEFAKDCLQQIIDSPEATEEDRQTARSMMHTAIDMAAEVVYDL